MSKHFITFLELHDPLFMQGSNLGIKINAAQKGAKIYLDTDEGTIWIYFKGKMAGLPMVSAKSWDIPIITDELATIFGLNSIQETEKPKRGRPPLTPTVDVEIDEAARHRAEVRARSANAFATNPAASNDTIVQQSRAAAMGIKQHTTAQVNTAQQVGELAGVTGKKKAISHAQLQAQVAAEAKE